MTLGEILHMGSATVGPVDQNQKDRYFVLFSSTLLILSVSARMSGFIYEVSWSTCVLVYLGWLLDHKIHLKLRR